MGMKIWTTPILAAALSLPAGFAAAQDDAMGGAGQATQDMQREQRADDQGMQGLRREQRAGQRTDRDPTAVLPGRAMEAQNQGRLIRVEQWIGQDVKNQAGEDLGEVNDFAIDPREGRAPYFVLSAGGKMHALPIQAFQPSVEDALIINAQPEDFENAQGFDADGEWPAQADPNLAQQLGLMDEAGQDMQQMQRQAGQLGQQARQQAGQMAQRAQDEAGQIGAEARDQAGQLGQPGQQARAGQERDEQVSGMGDADWQRRASQLTGASVRANNDEVGEVSDLVIDTQTGRILYAIVDPEGGLIDMDDSHSLVPWQALAVDQQNQALTLNGDPAALEQTKFEGDELPDLTDPQHMQRTYQAFGLDANPEVYGFAQPGEQGQAGQQQPGQMQNQQQRQQQQPQSQRQQPGQQPNQQQQDAQQDNQGMGGMGR